jgi:hypothetical protein
MNQTTYLDFGFDSRMRRLPFSQDFTTPSHNDAFNEIADKSVRSKKLAASAIDSGLLADGSVTNGKIADNAITTGKINNNEVTNAKLYEIATTLIKGRISSGTGVVEDLTPAEVRSILGLAYGTYTPTLTNVANLDASTAYECQYLKVGNTVVVSGKVDLDPTTTLTSTQLGISLPVASNIGSLQDVGGVAFASGVVSQGASILGDVSNDRAQLQFICSDVTNQAMYFIFSYQVI